MSNTTASVVVDGRTHVFRGRWVNGSPWQRFGLYNSYVVIRSDGQVLKMPAHAGELVPGATEDLVAAIVGFRFESGHPQAPLTLELDPTYRCASRNCGGFCFSAAYRTLTPSATIPTELMERIIEVFRSEGGRVVRFDGGGDPLMHPDVRSGRLVECAAERGLKTTILTAGDLLDQCDLRGIAQSECYVRLSLNAATNQTRKLFHGNEVPLTRILERVEVLVSIISSQGSEVPVGATFLLAPMNYKEVLDAALMVRNVGIRHFPVRRILGPNWLRPQFTPTQESEVAEILELGPVLS